ncbi:MAG: class Ib ribonucleoside-diphosphate reductase assembly flavoprotein NrdI [Enterococcus sp.]
MVEINLVYISLTGNTKDFIHQLKQFLAQQEVSLTAINVKDVVTNGEAFQELTIPFVSFLPAFLEGGNGIENGYQEILTTPLREYLEFADNYKRCYGIVGSGNRNFNKQFALSAHQYAEYFGFPYLDEYELRGTANDVTRIGRKLIKLQEQANQQFQKAGE